MVESTDFPSDIRKFCKNYRNSGYSQTENLQKFKIDLEFDWSFDSSFGILLFKLRMK